MGLAAKDAKIAKKITDTAKGEIIADARPRTLRTSRCLAATFGSVAATWLEAMPRQSRHHRRPLRVRRPQDTNTGLKPDTK